ncbi:hypothetical protein M758_UG068300 [Ceratodon purpureus]|nr:hypothetical protein M758_UG068300 [Ceratodon purpureus]
MDVHKEREVGKTAAEVDSNALDAGKSSSSEVEDRDAKIDAGKSNSSEVENRNAKRKNTEVPREYCPVHKCRCEDFCTVSGCHRKKGDDCQGPWKGFEGSEKESDMGITPRENSENSGRIITTGEKDGAQSSCDPLEYISEVWRKYEEHCQFVEANPECYALKLTLEEFVGQTDADESEFGPTDTLETNWEEIIHATLPFEERIRLWKQPHNRFVQVEWRKKKGRRGRT